ncbi:CHAT domain-containing protein [Archangium gephyra]|uniref:CHAT domain-containing protein n=1 Tax=Archangium gephyra TaxID=48 RepID=A0AAC8TDR1_9BACT|nr:CHAT domain-containing protein [Archangium gephyra]AKJ02097.1 High-affnity carbon uptake protein Hat/HatR [Archangium gephyra]REG28971.1 CHAT domain-containing protein [Archangium gephyra]
MSSSGGWLEIEIDLVGGELRARGLGCRNEQPEPYTLGPGFTMDFLGALASRVSAAAGRGEPLGAGRAQAVQDLHGALFRGELQEVLARLREAFAGRPLLLRLMLREEGLQAFPWEALCEPRTEFGFLGNSPKLLPVRGVRSSEPWQPREVRGAVRVLAIAPLHEGAPGRLHEALHESLESGAVEWLEPLTGRRAGKAFLFEYLRPTAPHVIHFLGHGGLKEGKPVLRLADEEGEESWVPVELLAQQLQQVYGRGPLRLIVLEACEGAKPGALASAAELLARTGVDAVIAHLWPVRADVARRCSSAFYRALTGEGDVALSLNEARRQLLLDMKGSAEAFSPVLYLRGHDSVLFDFAGRKVLPHPSAGVPPPGARAPALALRKLLEEPFTLFVGDLWEGQDPILHGLYERLHRKLAGKMGVEPPAQALSALAQHFVLHLGKEALDAEFQQVFGQTDFMPPLAGALARRLGAGVHVTLLRLPVLELALARYRPDLTIHVIQPSLHVGGDATIMRREAGGDRWEQLKQVPASLEAEQGMVVLRLCSGYLPVHDFRQPFLTEDDYLLGARGLESLLTPDLAAWLQGELRLHPVLLLGLSMLNWNHRILLYRLFGGRQLDRGSLAILSPEAREQELWERGKGLPNGQGLQTLELTDEDLVAQLEALRVGEVA